MGLSQRGGRRLSEAARTVDHARNKGWPTPAWIAHGDLEPAGRFVLQEFVRGRVPTVVDDVFAHGVLAYSWQAQVRLHKRFRSVAARKNRNVAAVAVARELAGFVWGLMNEQIDAV